MIKDNTEIKIIKDGFLETPQRELREKIVSFEQQLSEIPGAEFGDNEKCPLKHTFADGVYVREIFIPKGMMIVGKIHRHSHPNFLIKGEVSVVTENGGVERLKAPISIISPANTKRVVYSHEDTVWITVHVTDKTDLKEIEQEIILEKYEESELTEECIKVLSDINKEGD